LKTPNFPLQQLVTYTVPFGWVRHAGGIGKLLEARGPWRHKDRSSRKVFLENRINVVRGVCRLRNCVARA
jgi:hypothetical protein